MTVEIYQNYEPIKMKQIFSKIDADKLLHIINRCNEIVERTNVAPDNQFLQLATLRLKKGLSLDPINIFGNHLPLKI